MCLSKVSPKTEPCLQGKKPLKESLNFQNLQKNWYVGLSLVRKLFNIDIEITLGGAVGFGILAPIQRLRSALPRFNWSRSPPH